MSTQWQQPSVFRVFVIEVPESTLAVDVVDVRVSVPADTTGAIQGEVLSLPREPRRGVRK